MQTNDFLGNTWTYDCMGCAIAQQTMRVPGDLIQKTKYFCVHQDPLIPLPGFLVIASVRHIRSIAEMQETEYNEFAQLVKTAHQAIKTVVQLEALTIIQEESSPHFHLWFFPWLPKVVTHYGRPSLAKIRDIMTDQRQRLIDRATWKDLRQSIENIKALLV